MKFIHAADIHLDSPMIGLERYESAPVHELRLATRRAFDNMITLAIEESVDFILIAGDLYDGDWPDYKTGLFFAAGMRKLSDCEIPVFIVSGNHDAQSKLTKSLRLPPNVFRFPHKKPDTKILDNLGAAIHGQSYPKPALFENIAADYPSAIPNLFNIGLLHTSANGREGHEKYAPCNLNQLEAKEYDYWALGHIHKREILCNDPPILFSGNIQGRHFRETGAKGCSLVEVTSAKKVEIVEKHTDVARWYTLEIDVSDSPNFDDVLNRLTNQLQIEFQEVDDLLLLVRIMVIGKCKAHTSLMADSDKFLNEVCNAAFNYFGERIWIERVIIRTEPLMQAYQEGSNGPIASIIRRLNNLTPSDPIVDNLKNELLSLKRDLPRNALSKDHFLDLENQSAVSDLAAEIKESLMTLLYAAGNQ